MAAQDFPGSTIAIGPRLGNISPQAGFGSFIMDAANEAIYFIGRFRTSDGSSHTINTTGSSSIAWRTGASTFASGSTTVKVGIADVDMAAGPAPRAVNSTNVVTMDVSASFTGGGGGVTTDAWQTHVPDTGTKTIANGDLVAIVVQMTARGGADSITASFMTLSAAMNRPTVSRFTASYANLVGAPNAFVTFADGAYGWIEGTEIASVTTNRSFNSGSPNVEYGQLYQFPFPLKIYGMYGIATFGNNADIVLYSDPLGTPSAQKTVAMDANTMGTAGGLFFEELFTSPYSLAANTPIAAVLKPGASAITAYYKTLGNAAHRICDPGGTASYGIARASGAFAAENSNLDQYYIGLLVGGFDDGASGGSTTVTGVIGS